MLIRSFAVLVFGFAAAGVSAQAAPEAFVAGRDFQLLDPPVPTADASRVEVIEVFAYGCIHCATLQPFVDSWKPKLPEGVDFSYAPLGFGGVAETFARAYFAADSLGLNERAHAELFKAIHTERRQFRSAEDITAFYADFGVKQDDFERAMRSFAVNTRMNRLKQQMPRYGVEGTPSMIVNGKYRVAMPSGSGPQGMLRIVEFLIAKEQAALAKS
jgi:thiol:disulfide interchange protein DsbA